MYIDERLVDIYNEAINILKDNEKELIKYTKYSSLEEIMNKVDKVIVNNRVKSRRGLYSPTDRKIEISGYMLTYPKNEILTTMVHELLHSFKDSVGHKGNWKLRANLLKNITGLNIQRCRNIDCDEEVKRIEENNIKLSNKKKYKCRCVECGSIYTYYRYTKFIKYPERFTHKNCGGRFERYE